MASKLRAALSSFDAGQLKWCAEGFAAERYVKDSSTLSELVSDVEKANPADLDDALRVVAQKGPFACFALACLARHAGVGANVTHDGVMKELPLAVAGDLIVNGPLVCNIENWLLVAGDIKADALITSADVIVLGNVVVRDGVIGLNNWCQSLWVHGTLESPIFITEDYSVAAGEGSEEIELSDEAVDALLAPGLAKELRQGQGDGGPDEAVGRLLERIEQRQSLFRPQ